MEMIMQPWPWYVVGPLITLTMFLLLWFGNEFGVSSTLRDACAAMGGGKYSDFFKIDWRANGWNITFVLGTAIGGFIATYFLASSGAVDINPSTIENLRSLNIQNPGSEYLPGQIFSLESIGLLNIIYLIIGGFFVGFGARYAGGCTSGHAISGLSNLQVPSLIVVIGFFIGGLIMTHFIFPHLLILF